MAVNVIGSFLVAKHALAVMQPGGSLIVNSSVVGLTSDAGISAYATSSTRSSGSCEPPPRKWRRAASA